MNHRQRCSPTTVRKLAAISFFDAGITRVVIRAAVAPPIPVLTRSGIPGCVPQGLIRLTLFPFNGAVHQPLDRLRGDSPNCSIRSICSRWASPPSAACEICYGIVVFYSLSNHLHGADNFLQLPARAQFDPNRAIPLRSPEQVNTKSPSPARPASVCAAPHGHSQPGDFRRPRVISAAMVLWAKPRPCIRRRRWRLRF